MKNWAHPVYVLLIWIGDSPQVWEIHVHSVAFELKIGDKNNVFGLRKKGTHPQNFFSTHE